MAPPAAGKDMSFAKLPAAAKVGVLIGIVALLCAGYYFVLHMSLSDSISTADAQFMQMQADLASAEQQQREYLELRAQLDAREPIDRQNLRILPERAEIAAFLQDLNRLAEVNGLQVKLVEPRPDEAEEFFVRIPVKLELAGRYHQLAKFFFNIGRLERAINMEDIELKLPTVVGEETVIQVEVLATTFRRPDSEEPAGGQ